MLHAFIIVILLFLIQYYLADQRYIPDIVSVNACVF